MLILLGAYLMGGLREKDAAAVRAHLETCAMCKAEHDDLAPVPGWLSLLSDEQDPPRLTIVPPDPAADGRTGQAHRQDPQAARYPLILADSAVRRL